MEKMCVNKIFETMHIIYHDYFFFQNVHFSKAFNHFIVRNRSTSYHEIHLLIFFSDYNITDMSYIFLTYT